MIERRDRRVRRDKLGPARRAAHSSLEDLPGLISTAAGVPVSHNLLLEPDGAASLAEQSHSNIGILGERQLLWVGQQQRGALAFRGVRLTRAPVSDGSTHTFPSKVALPEVKCGGPREPAANAAVFFRCCRAQAGQCLFAA